MNKEMSPQESLQIISEMIQKTQDNIRDGSTYFLLWGWLTLFASLAHYILLTQELHEYSWMPWPVLMIFGGLVSAVLGIRESKKTVVRTHIDRSIAYVWRAFGIFLVILLLLMGTVEYTIIYPLMMCIWAMGTFITGGILRFKPLVIGSMVCWVLAAASFWMSFPQQLLTMAVAITACYLIHGYLLKRA